MGANVKEDGPGQRRDSCVGKKRSRRGSGHRLGVAQFDIREVGVAGRRPAVSFRPVGEDAEHEVGRRPAQPTEAGRSIRSMPAAAPPAFPAPRISFSIRSSWRMASPSWARMRRTRLMSLPAMLRCAHEGLFQGHPDRHLGSPANDRGRWRGYLHLLRSGHGRCRRPHPSSRVTVRQNSSICRQVRRSARSACPVPCPARTSAWRTRASGTAGPGFSARERRHREADKKGPFASRIARERAAAAAESRPSHSGSLPVAHPQQLQPCLVAFAHYRGRLVLASRRPERPERSPPALRRSGAQPLGNGTPERRRRSAPPSGSATVAATLGRESPARPPRRPPSDLPPVDDERRHAAARLERHARELHPHLGVAARQS